jgi:signal transduction histidine kinase
MPRVVRSRIVAATVGWLVLVLVIGILDVASGPDYGFGFFYLLVVVPTAWFVGRGPGLLVAVASGIAWFLADIAQQRVGTFWPALWNASSRLLVFVLAAWLVDAVRRERERMRTLDRERANFMRVLEHELAGPGRDLAGGLHALQAAGGATAAQLQPLVERAQDLEFLSRDFVALGQLQSGDLWLQHRPVNLRELVEDVRYRASEGPRMPITLPSDPLRLEGDEARLRQAILSLLNAARESAGEGDVTLDLRKERGSAKLTISTGTGPFVAVVGDDGGGVGIELARMIIQAHRGRLDHRREAVSKAVRFVVLLPLASG